MFDESKVDTIDAVVETAMQQKLQFNLLRKMVFEWITARGGRCLSVDRLDGVITIITYTDEGERILVRVPESSEYRDSVRISTW